MTKWQMRRGRTGSVGFGKWTRSLVLLCERDVSYWLLDVGLYPARPAERFARRMPISLPQEASSLRTGSHQRMILACTRPILVGHAVELAMPNHLPRRPSPSRPSAGPARPAPASSARLQPRTDDAPSWTWRATTPTPAIPSRTAAGPTATPHDLIPVGHNRRRRPDTGHLDTQTPAPDTDHLDRPRGTPDARTGHRTGTRTR